jgi:hypothetical protein
MIKIMLVLGVGIRDISAILNVSVKKASKTLRSAKYQIKPACNHYDCLEIGEFWTYVGRKTNKVWLIYAYHRESGESAAYVWDKRKRTEKLTCCFSKKLFNHWKAFSMSFFYINYGCI